MKPMTYRIVAQTTLIVTAGSREEAESAAFVHITTAPPVKKTRKPRRRKDSATEAAPAQIEPSIKLVAAEVVSTEQNTPSETYEAAMQSRPRSFRPINASIELHDCEPVGVDTVEAKYKPATLTSGDPINA